MQLTPEKCRKLRTEVKLLTVSKNWRQNANYYRAAKMSYNMTKLLNNKQQWSTV